MEKTTTRKPLRVVEFGIKTTDELLADFAEAFEAARLRMPYTPREGVYFADLATMRKVLTPKRLEILRTIKKEQPASVYQLAKLVRRGFSAVLRDVEFLVQRELIKLPRAQKTSRRARRPSVDYDAINVCIGI